jgi:hypothetical protein
LPELPAPVAPDPPPVPRPSRFTVPEDSTMKMLWDWMTAIEVRALEWFRVPPRTTTAV